MLIKIGDFEFTECWDGVLYKKLSDYPRITDWELQNIHDFIEYEAANGRTCDIEAEASVLGEIERFEKRYTAESRVHVPQKITECTACPTYKGCMTDLVCHTSPIENALKILDCGSLLSPVRARGLSAGELKAEKRNAANDPEDYFYYIMFAWGNCQAGDRLAVERRLGRFPDDTDLSSGFVPGVRFFFRYDRLTRHPAAVFDGVLPLKVRDEVVLEDWLHCIVIPEMFRGAAEKHIPELLQGRTFYLESGGCDIWQWSEKVYEFAKHIEQK